MSNGWLKTLHFRAFMETVEKLQLMGIVLAGWCKDTQSNSFIHFAKRCTLVLYLFQISNVLRHNSFGGCSNLVLSWSQGRKRNKRTFHHFHYLQDHLWLFQDLDYLPWACALLANNINCIFTTFIQIGISNVFPNALLWKIQSQSGFNNWPARKKCQFEIHAIQTVFLDPINVASLIG